MIDLTDFLRDIPNWKEYYTVDEIHRKTTELAREYPEIEYINLGKSTEGDTIDCLKVGEGKYNALVHGFPNSEEPIGGNLIEYFARKLAEEHETREEIDYSWYLIPCSDPDGARINEGFMKGPHMPLNFSLNYYRTPSCITPEWCFPFRFGPLDLNSPTAETRALMSLMDRIDFHFVSSLHMMKWGGITYQVPHVCPELYAPLWDSASKFDIFPRKRPGTTVAPGVSVAYYLTVARGYLRQWSKGNTNIEPITGCYIYEYGQMRNPDMFMMIPESTFWYDERMLNDAPTDAKVGESLEKAQRTVEETQSFMLETWMKALPHLKTGTKERFMIEQMMEPLITKHTNVSNPTLRFDDKVHNRKATVAEQVAIEGRELSFRMTHLGGLWRVFEAEPSKDETLTALGEEVYDKMVTYDKRLNEEYKVITNPIRNNVGAMTSSILHSAIYAAKKQH